jgi:hypothetical protein
LLQQVQANHELLLSFVDSVSQQGQSGTLSGPANRSKLLVQVYSNDNDYLTLDCFQQQDSSSRTQFQLCRFDGSTADRPPAHIAATPAAYARYLTLKGKHALRGQQLHGRDMLPPLQHPAAQTLVRCYKWRSKNNMHVLR